MTSTMPTRSARDVVPIPRIPAAARLSGLFGRRVSTAAKISDAKKRYELYAKALGILNQEIPAISLAFVPRYFTYRQKVRGFNSDGGDRFNTVTAGLSRVWIEP